MPWDKTTVFEMVKKCSKVLLLQEDSLFGGYMGEIAAQISEHCFEYLDGPIVRVASLDTPVPFANKLESEYLPKDRLNAKIIASWLRRNPEFFDNHPEVLTFLNPPKLKHGEAVVDLQQFMINRLQKELISQRQREKQILACVVN